ncbi:uncharacterized protein PHALS_03218 [Plasmopara halstedii]|uniref:Uncharacterized protein n=1 Tax=Plasmopara halstedii TaxID=4781 RepID=A0A0P1AXU6_PLAHL|nr:uncharacterized protein PHALS_03218 [Plasmopara halstedii]CEG46620.1 hypothetical protein PHALS_03218 [Plasmopara halstedii]|eukprot:XP_024582989.1 hypothetical protein PHALS_03218 [Plasmopara halstedii]
MAYAMERAGVDGLIHFAKTFTGNLLSETWFSYAAFALRQKSIESWDIVVAMVTLQHLNAEECLKIFKKILSTFEDVENTQDVSFSDTTFVLWKQESDTDASIRQTRMRFLLHGMADGMIKYLEKLAEKPLD